VAEWVRLCGLGEAPAPGGVTEVGAICLANLDGELSALDNLCPHRQGPLGQGWLEGEAVVCPWHAWAFHAKTGRSEFPFGERVKVFPLRVAGDAIEIDRG
jgi:nitrite reductase (NADH) small subunit